VSPFNLTNPTGHNLLSSAKLLIITDEEVETLAGVLKELAASKVQFCGVGDGDGSRVSLCSGHS
jgi:hypothetical protein